MDIKINLMSINNIINTIFLTMLLTGIFNNVVYQYIQWITLNLEYGK